MTANDFEQSPPVSAYGQQRRQEWMARLRANHDMAERATLQAHGQSEDHRVVQAGQAGLFGHATPQDMGQAVSERQATVGGDWYGRPLERQGGTFDHAAESPAPARVDLRFVDRQGQEPGVSPLLAHMRGRN